MQPSWELIVHNLAVEPSCVIKVVLTNPVNVVPGLRVVIVNNLTLNLTWQEIVHIPVVLRRLILLLL
jgi:hypothetical protein